MNNNIKIIKVKTINKLEELRNMSIFTWVGMSDDEENLEAIYNGLKENGFKDEIMKIYIFKGSLMNESYDLKGTNRYPDNLTFVSVEYYYNPMAKIQFGARWLDDIIDNDIRRNKK